MKKIIPILLVVALALSLAACGKGKEPTSPTDEVTDPPVVATDLTSSLQEIANLQSGSAGVSLKAAAIAGTLMDWYVEAQPKEADIKAEATVFYDGLDAEAKAAFGDNLNTVFNMGMDVCATNGAELLESAGYSPKGQWSAEDTKTVFAAIYGGTDLAFPNYIAVYGSDDNAEKFVLSYATVDELTPDNVLNALINNGTVDSKAEVLNFDGSDPANVKLDLNDVFQTQAASLGTSGEYMLLGSLVNTFLTAFGGEAMTITINGSPLETGHNVYDSPLEFHADNVALD